ncbi:NUDIX domain-containing protein [Amnibacterium endophyticum]|uniref:NUDIX domain-containing protein n=1 Tax=Amnibacterium endophyticum TaxID=2109337 RepID=A0ABW4LB56_9MICO
MTESASVPPGPPPGPRDPADGWVDLPGGRRFWGRNGAAGLLAVTPAGEVLLQHRVGWSHFGGTWGLPGGARHAGEGPVEGAFREAHEETAIDVAALRPRFAALLDLGAWSYTTVVAAVPGALPVAVSDPESTGLEWVPADLVAQRALHPGLEASWPQLRAEAAAPDHVLVVDAANVVGSRPDGWWRDRTGAASRLLAGLAVLDAVGLAVDEPAADGLLPVVRRWPAVVAVLEGEARAAGDVDGVEVVRAERDGDGAVVEQVQRLVADDRATTVVTADRGLGARVEAAGGRLMRPGALLALLDG